jgi:hypothetical protein
VKYWCARPVKLYVHDVFKAIFLVKIITSAQYFPSANISGKISHINLGKLTFVKNRRYRHSSAGSSARLGRNLAGQTGTKLDWQDVDWTDKNPTGLAGS